MKKSFKIHFFPIGHNLTSFGLVKKILGKFHPLRRSKRASFLGKTTHHLRDWRAEPISPFRLQLVLRCGADMDTICKRTFWDSAENRPSFYQYIFSFRSALPAWRAIFVSFYFVKGLWVDGGSVNDWNSPSTFCPKNLPQRDE